MPLSQMNQPWISIRPTELRFQFILGIEVSAAFVHYSLFESYLLSGPKVSSGAHQYLSNVQKVSKTAWNHGLKTMWRYTHRYRRFGNFQMATDHCWCRCWPRIEGFAIKKCVHTENDVYINGIFESPDVENLPIMKIILKNEKFMW